MRSVLLAPPVLLLLLSQVPRAFAEPNVSSAAPPAAPPAASPAAPPVAPPDALPGSAPDPLPVVVEPAPPASEAPAAEADPGLGLTLPKHIDAIALTISGGVSLGAYEAGQVYFLSESLRRSPGAARIYVTAGTSAGSANALIAGTDGCMKGGVPAEESLGYRVWTPSGLDQLFDPKQVTQDSLFMTKPLIEGFDKITASWKQGVAAGCEFAFSVAATRSEGYEVSLAPGLVVPRQAERFTVHVEGRGAQVPKFTNYLDRSKNIERPLLPVSDGADLSGAKDFAAIGSTVLASTAFPIAFPAQPIPHCVSEAVPEDYDPKRLADEIPTCARPTRVDTFVDGGVFDNNPLGSSLRIATNGLYLDAAGRVQFRKVPTGGVEKTPEILHAFVDPDLTRYPAPEEQTHSSKNDPLLSLVGRLGAQVLTSMRGQELAMQAETNRSILHRLWLIRSSSPPTSGLLGAFFGFFEKDFRDFDFHLGTYDTFVELRSPTGVAIGTSPHIAALERAFAGPAAGVAPQYHKLACILANHESEAFGHLKSLCGGEKMRNFRVLLQVSLDRLFSTCKNATMNTAARKEHVLCSVAQTGGKPPQVDSAFAVRGERLQGKDEGEFDYALRLFADYDFEFKDLGLKRGHASDARIQVRRRLDNMVTALANAQPSLTDRTVILTGGRTAVNGIAYEPPRKRVYVQVGGGIALGYLGRLGDLSSFFWNPDLRAGNMDGLLTGRSYEFNFTPSLGAEYLILPLSSSVFQVSFGARAGFRFAATDSFATHGCDAAAAQGDSRNCSQFVVQTPVNFSLLERVRLSLTPYFYPIGQSFGHNPVDFELSIGAELF